MLKRKCWFVDMENIGDSRFKLFVSNISIDDIVYIVYSDVVHGCAVESLKPLQESGIEYRLIRSPKCGDNALDFVLVAELSRVSLSNPDDEYIILSLDTGFDSVVEYLRIKGIKINRVGPAYVGLYTRQSLDAERERQPLTDIQRRILYDFVVTRGLEMAKNVQLQHLHDICQRWCVLTPQVSSEYNFFKDLLQNKEELYARKLEVGFKW